MSQHALIVENRRSLVLEYHSTNKTQREIAALLNVSVTTVNKDLQWLKQEAEDNIKNHMTSLAHQYSKTCAALDVITKRAFEEAEQAHYVKDKHALLTLARDTVKIRWELSTDASVIEEAMSFVEVTNNQVKHEPDNQDNNFSLNQEEQPTKQQLQQTNHYYDNSKEEDSIVVAAEEEIDREIQAIDRRIDNTKRSEYEQRANPLLKANESEIYDSRIIQPETKGTNADTAIGHSVPDSTVPARDTPVKKFAAEPEEKAPLDILSSELQVQQREQEALNQQAKEDAMRWKPSHSILDVDNSWSNAKKRVLLR